MDLDDYKIGLYDSNSQINQEELPDTDVTINESYYNELNEAYETLRDVKKIFKEWYALNSFPLEKTSDEKLKLAELENLLIKKLKL